MTRLRLGARISAGFELASGAAAWAQSNPNQLTLPAGGSGFFADFRDFLQSYVDFMLGPAVFAISMAIIVVAGAVVFFNPKEDSNKTIAKVVLTIAIIANSPAILDLLIF